MRQQSYPTTYPATPPKTQHTRRSFTQHLPRLSLLALAIAGMSQVQAADIEMGEFNLKVDSKLTLGSSWRTEKRNNDYIAAGTLGAQGITSGIAGNPTYQGNSSSNTDNGNMNFDKGDAFSQVITGNHTLGLTHNKYRNVGAKVSFRYWYDHALSELDGPTNAGVVDDWKDTTAFDDAKSGIELMDAYVWGEFDVAGRPAQAILGRHVLNWGQSSFIQGGQNAANPIDVQALRRPGAELRDALLPVNMLSGSIALDEMGNFNLEGYYQLEWQRTRADACGTYFANTDFAAEGCDPVYYQSGLSEPANAAGTVLGTPFAALEGAYALANGYGQLGLSKTDMNIAKRLDDKEPSSSGQFGIALKWYAEQLNGTEFGFSYQNVHSRLPMVGGKVSAGSDPQKAATYAGAIQAVAAAATGGDLVAAAGLLKNTPAGANATINGAQAMIAAAGNNDPTQYFIEFPEDQQIIAASFATLLPTGTAWSGEFTYRPDTPIQINANDVLVRGLLGNMGYDPKNPKHNNLDFVNNSSYAPLLARLPQEIRDLEAGMQKGYREHDVFQFQTTFIHDINRVLAADNLRIIGEVGFTYVNDLPDTKDMRFGRSSVYGSFGKEGSGQASDVVNPAVVFADNGYVTELSWGYRLVGQLEYTNALISGLTLKPTLSWSHDVSGYGPEPGSQFYEGRMILGTALAAEYMNTYTANLSYTNYLTTDYWDLDDRDFVSLSVGVNF
ncbi:MAG TPA: DUF1302 domain-containing protein [Marinospirillum sp.]|uniref:DUF1302 domain-containing protein n=1 Tax=Marinospirillum sp. TaxID=2183934 RepID=UPI002B481AB2|nr:DUF1302 domain-containing protein [Marinospirillum sp.]HKM15216.1 DUF1302 domain-containing protein [Marinospirillum sp.]